MSGGCSGPESEKMLREILFCGAQITSAVFDFILNEQINKQRAAAEGSCSDGLANHFLGGNSQSGDVHDDSSQY